MTAAKRYKRLIVWSRRDLRVAGNASLHHACRQADHVIPLFILDDAILKRADTGAARGEFLLDALAVLNRNLQKRTVRLIVRRSRTPDGAYVRRWVPERACVPARMNHTPWKLSPAERGHLGCADYPAPVVDHAMQRSRAHAFYQKAAQKQEQS